MRRQARGAALVEAYAGGVDGKGGRGKLRCQSWSRGMDAMLRFRVEGYTVGSGPPGNSPAGCPWLSSPPPPPHTPQEPIRFRVHSVKFNSPPTPIQLANATGVRRGTLMGAARVDTQPCCVPPRPCTRATRSLLPPPVCFYTHSLTYSHRTAIGQHTVLALPVQHEAKTHPCYIQTFVGRLPPYGGRRR